MPQATKVNVRLELSKEAQKELDKEQKRNRGVMSCAECRRLKLKCDKTVPCSSCKRRGCSAICPNGKLTTGQGTRFVLADTKKLHDKILLMSDRIRQLEDALAVLQSTLAPQTPHHPLLHRDLLGIKSIIDLHVAIDDSKASTASERADEDSEYIEASGTLALRDDGAVTSISWFRETDVGLAPKLNHLLAKDESEEMTISSSSKDPILSDLPGPITHLSKMFPLAPVFTDVVDLDYLVQHHLPPWPRARQLCELYLSQASWFFGAVTKRQLLEECLPLWYSEASDLLQVAAGVSVPSTQPSASGEPAAPQGKTSHELALLFVIFCFGALTDNALPPAPDNEEASMYCALTRAALNLEPVLDRPPSVTTVQTLALLAIYQGLESGENSIESTWGVFGLATKLAQSIGLHRDCARWQLPNPEVQKRRALFWELFITDGWQSLATGRLATFYLPFVDCGLPNDPESTIDDDGSVLPSFPAWKARFGYECVSAVIQNTQIAKVPKYSMITDLDRRAREMELPKYAQRVPLDNAGLTEAMEHYMPLNYRNYVLVYIHRCFFAEAVSNNPTDPMQSPYAPSFLAGFRSACEILGNLRIQFDLFPAQIARFWVLWTHAFSSSVMLASVVTHASGAGSRSKTTGVAMAELRRAVNLFQQASTYGGRAVKFLPILQRLLHNAEQAYSTAKPTVVRDRDVFASSSAAASRPMDELAIFSGRVHTVVTRASPRQPSPSVSVSVTSSSTTAAEGEAARQLHPTLRDRELGEEYDTEADAVMDGGDVSGRPQQPQQAILYPPTISATTSSGVPPSYASTQGSYPEWQAHADRHGPVAYHDHPHYAPPQACRAADGEPSSEARYAAYAPLPTEYDQPPTADCYRAEPPRTGVVGYPHAARHPSAYDVGYEYANDGSVLPMRPPPDEEVRLQETWQSFGVYVGSPRPIL